MRETALVTGASGFLGRHLVRALCDAGYPVVAWIRGAPAAPAPAGARFEPWPRLEALNDALARLEHPIIYHLAATADRNVSDPLAHFDNNIRLTASLIEAGAQAGARGFVHAGSCTEYGVVPDRVRVAETAPLAARDLYGASKAAAGIWAQAVARQAGLGFAWARLFALYGPGLRSPRLLPTIHAALREKHSVDLTPGSQVLDWLYVGDAVAALLRLGRHAGSGGQGAFNLCTGHARTMREVATMFAERMGGDARLLRFGALAGRQNEPPWLVGDPAAARALGWSADTDITAGLDATIAALDREKDGQAQASVEQAARGREP